MVIIFFPLADSSFLTLFLLTILWVLPERGHFGNEGQVLLPVTRGQQDAVLHLNNQNNELLVPAITGNCFKKLFLVEGPLKKSRNS